MVIVEYVWGDKWYKWYKCGDEGGNKSDLQLVCNTWGYNIGIWWDIRHVIGITTSCGYIQVGWWIIPWLLSPAWNCGENQQFMWLLNHIETGMMCIQARSSVASIAELFKRKSTGTPNSETKEHDFLVDVPLNYLYLEMLKVNVAEKKEDTLVV